MHGYTYAASLAASQRIGWRIEDIIGGERRLDFARPFLPEGLARVRPLAFLDDEEQLVLNQIRGHGYLAIFGLVEEFILPFVLDHVRPHLGEDDLRTRALLAFAGEEAKHIHLFRTFQREFVAGFGTPCRMIGPPQAIAQAVLSRAPLSVALLILHIEWMTQRHYLDSIRDDAALDPQFTSLLKHHWMEEAQHARLDTLLVEALAEGQSRETLRAAVDGYLELGGLFDAAFAQQVEFDLEAFTAATGRRLDGEEAATFRRVQHQAQRWTFIGSGMSHPNVLATLGAIAPAERDRVAELAPQFC